MLQKMIKKNNCSIQKAISEAISDGLRHEIANLKKLEGDRLQSFIDIFSLSFATLPEIYYNKFNVLLCEQHIHDQLANFLPKKNLVVRVEIPKTNINVWCYEMFEDALMSNLFDDLDEEL